MLHQNVFLLEAKWLKKLIQIHIVETKKEQVHKKLEKLLEILQEKIVHLVLSYSC